MIPRPAARGRREGLLGFGRRFLELALQPDALAFYRSFIAQAPRFPILPALRRTHPPAPLGEIGQVLAAFRDRGAIEPAISKCGRNISSSSSSAFRSAWRRWSAASRRPEEERRLRAAIRLFLDGCRFR